MSNSPNSQRPALSPAVVERLFARFMAIYGAQKVATAWGNVDVAERNSTWGAALGRFDVHVLADACNDLAMNGTSWPPTLPEFVDVCERREQRPGHKLALPVPSRSKEALRQGAERMAEFKATVTVGKRRADGRDWARRVLERAERKDGALAPMTIQFAKEALGGTDEGQP